MKFLFDLFPVILFFATFKLSAGHTAELVDTVRALTSLTISADQAPVLAATFIAIAASIVQLVIIFVRGKKPEPMLWISFVIILVFGSLTLWLQNALFIKWKPSILYWVFGLILTYGTLTGRNFIKKLMGAQLQLPDCAWSVMQKAWIVFFVLTGALNLAVAYTCSTDTWVNFKLFGLLGLTFLFTIGIGVWVAHLGSTEQNNKQHSR